MGQCQWVLRNIGGHLGLGGDLISAMRSSSQNNGGIGISALGAAGRRDYNLSCGAERLQSELRQSHVGSGKLLLPPGD